jgi:hypothetical protein
VILLFIHESNAEKMRVTKRIMIKNEKLALGAHAFHVQTVYLPARFKVCQRRGNYFGKGREEVKRLKIIHRGSVVAVGMQKLNIDLFLFSLSVYIPRHV